MGARIGAERRADFAKRPDFPIDLIRAGTTCAAMLTQGTLEELRAALGCLASRDGDGDRGAPPLFARGTLRGRPSSVPGLDNSSRRGRDVTFRLYDQAGPASLRDRDYSQVRGLSVLAAGPAPQTAFPDASPAEAQCRCRQSPR